METSLFVYGTLAPGRQNGHILRPLNGTWQPGRIRGRLFAEGWGAAQGFPGIRLDPEAGEVRGLVFTAPGLADFLPELDAFEGEGYRRDRPTAPCGNLYPIPLRGMKRWNDSKRSTVP